MDTPPRFTGSPLGSEVDLEFDATVAVDRAADFEGELAGNVCDGPRAAISVAEAARQLGVGRARVYQLLEAGLLEALGVEPLRISPGSVKRRLQAQPPSGAPLAPLSAWAVLALASGDAAFTRHVAGLLGDPDRSRARSRLRERGLLELAPRLRERATCRGFVTGAEQLVDILADARLVLAGSSAARLLDGHLPDGSWPVDAYLPDRQLAQLVEQYALERDDRQPDLLLRAVPEPWPFPPHARVVPALVAALDLSESADTSLATFGSARLEALAHDVVADWRQRPPRRRPVRPIVPSGSAALLQPGARRSSSITDELWDDRAEQDAEQLVGLLFVAATPLGRSDITNSLRISPARLARACAVLQADPPRGLRLEDAGDQLGLVSAPACTATIERYLGKGAPEALSGAALEVLSVVAYEQPVTRADIRSIRGVDSDAVVETLMARKLIAEDPRFGGRGRPAFLVTTAAFLQRFGLSALGQLPPRPSPSTLRAWQPHAGAVRSGPAVEP